MTRVFRLFPFFLIFYECAIMLSNDMYLPAFPQIASQLDAHMNVVQISLTAWLAGNASIQLFLGPLSDRFGRKPILFAGSLLFLLTTLGCGFVTSIVPLILLRFLQGVGVCSFMVSGFASVHDLYDGRRAFHILAWMGSIAVLGPMIGPLLGAYVLLFGSWRLIFFLIFFLGIIGVIGLWASMVEPNRFPEQDTLSWKKLKKMYGKIFSNASFMVSSLSYGLLYAAIAIWFTASPHILIVKADISPQAFGWAQIPIFGGYILTAWAGKHLLDGLNKEKLLLAGLLFSVFWSAVMVVLSLLTLPLAYAMILPMMGFALGFGLAAPSLNHFCFNSCKEKRGAVAAVFYLCLIGMGAIGSLFVSITVETPFLVSCMIAICAFLSLALNSVVRRKC